MFAVPHPRPETHDDADRWEPEPLQLPVGPCGDSDGQEPRRDPHDRDSADDRPAGSHVIVIDLA